MSAAVQRADRTVATLLPLATMAAIFVLSSIPGSIAADDPASYRIFLWVPPDVQNVLHVPVFAVLAALWQRAAELWFDRVRLAAAFAWVTTVAYGGIDEWHQMHVPGRYASFTDLALDAVGASLGIGLVLVRRWRAQRP